MRFALVSAYPLGEDWHTRRLAEACARLGGVAFFRPHDFTVAVPAGLRISGNDPRAYDAWLLARPLGRRGDPDFHCQAYRLLAELGLPVLNPVDALLNAEDKVRTSYTLASAGVPTPPLFAAQSLGAACQALAELRCVVAKPPYGSLGIGVCRVTVGERGARRRLRDLIARHGLVVLQAYVGPRGRGRARDLRLFVVGGRVAAAVERVAPAGELATNFHRGGTVRSVRPAPDAEATAVRAARALGLEYAGVDLAIGEEGPTVLEVNGMPRWEGIFEATGRDMAEELARHAAALARRKELKVS